MLITDIIYSRFNGSDSNLIEVNNIKNSSDVFTIHMLKYSLKNKNLFVFL